MSGDPYVYSYYISGMLKDIIKCKNIPGKSLGLWIQSVDNVFQSLKFRIKYSESKIRIK